MYMLQIFYDIHHVPSEYLYCIVFIPSQIVQSCVSCLSAVVNTVTHNFTLVNDCFLKFFSELLFILLHVYLYSHDVHVHVHVYVHV